MSDAMSDEVEATRTEEASNEAEDVSTTPTPVDTTFITKTWRDDLALILEDKPLYVNRCTLACLSPVFDAMFSSNDEKDIILTGKFDDFLEFLQCIYPGKAKSVTCDNVFKVVRLAHEYQVKQLESACDVFLVQHLSTTESPNDVYEIMAIACDCKMDTITAKCIQIVAERPEEEFENFKSQFTLPDEILNTITARMLHSLKTKYKYVFGHEKTSRAFYEFLGIEAKQKDLIDAYTNGRVVGDMVDLELRSSTLKAFTKMNIDGKEFSLDVARADTWSNRDITLTVKYISTDKQDDIKCVCAVYVLNWMRDKENIRNISELKLQKDNKFTVCKSLNECNPSLLRSEQAGFVGNNGYIKLKIYLFCM